MSKENFKLGAAVVAIVIAAVVLFNLFGNMSPRAGNTTASFWDATLGYKVAGTAVFNSAGILVGPTAGTCYLAPSTATIAASSTISIDCQATAAPNATATWTTSALTGVTLGDSVFVQLSTTTAGIGTAGNFGLVVTGASASTTSGYITLRLANMNGTTYTFPIGTAASGTASYLINR